MSKSEKKNAKASLLINLPYSKLLEEKKIHLLKLRPYLFLKLNIIESKYAENSPFYVQYKEMASETPFVPRGLR